MWHVVCVVCKILRLELLMGVGPGGRGEVHWEISTLYQPQTIYHHRQPSSMSCLILLNVAEFKTVGGEQMALRSKFCTKITFGDCFLLSSI